MSDRQANQLKRIPTGLRGLDTILRGGVFRGGVYMLLAPPGAGKTILANQICFKHVAAGGRALYVTLLTESHSRLIAQLQSFTFFDPAIVGASLIYVTGYQALEKEKLKGLVSLLRQMVRDHEATILVIDGFLTADAFAETELETRKFIHELQAFVELAGCTTFILTGASKNDEPYALRTMVDGLFELRLDEPGMAGVRTIEISKFRGSNILLGRHALQIANEGISIYPRIEAYLGTTVERPDPSLSAPATFGIKGLDGMLGGGLRSGSVTIALGSPGSGKTLLGLSLLASGAAAGEQGLYFGFFETPAELCRKAEGVGLPLGEHVKNGLVELLWRTPLDSIADASAEVLLARIRERGVRRLVIDGVSGFKNALSHSARSKTFLAALFNELRSLEVVTLLTDDAPRLLDIESPEGGLTALLDNVILLRHVELRSRLHKLVSVLKIRNGAGDSSLREFTIGPRGFVVSSASESAEATLSDLNRITDAGNRKALVPKKGNKGRRQ